jgi:hypothetical protein
MGKGNRAHPTTLNRINICSQGDLFMVDTLTTPFGLWGFAKDYLEAAKIVGTNPQLEISPPRYYLLGHSAELALKSFLLAKGATLSELKHSIGHDLEKAWERAIEVGLLQFISVPSEEESSLRLLNKTYKVKEHEYIVAGYRHWPQPVIMQSFVARVLDAIRELCFNVTVEIHRSS